MDILDIGNGVSVIASDMSVILIVQLTAACQSLKYARYIVAVVTSVPTPVDMGVIFGYGFVCF